MNRLLLTALFMLSSALGQSEPSHWAFLRPLPQPVPRISEASSANALDKFLLAKLGEAKLEPTGRASAAALGRRLTMVLHGLLPDPEELSCFEKDNQPNAYERLVDRALASPRYGERMARHWLDVVRFAESNGYETNRERLTAYPFRDYVILAFNEDRHYDRFVREQLAGDSLGEDVATGFLVAGPVDIVKSPDPTLTLNQRQDELADMVNTTGTAFLGLTLGCARCHDHKFDPISQKDYYAAQAVFAGVKHGERKLQSASKVDALARELAELRAALQARGVRPPASARYNEEIFPPRPARHLRFTIRATEGGAEPCLDELELFDEAGHNVALASEGVELSASGTLPGHAIHRLSHVNDGRFGNSHSWISHSAGSGWVRITLPAEKRVCRVVWSRDREGSFRDRVAKGYLIELSQDGEEWTTITSSNGAAAQPASSEIRALLAKVDLLEKRREAEGKAWIGTFEQPDAVHRLFRGDPLQAREIIPPAVPASFAKRALEKSETQRRLGLAEWITEPANPLAARVMVNRLWLWLFGTGLVDTPSDFGLAGARPSHPELLDWLALDFAEHGFSMKRLHRLLLTSAAFQRSSAPHAEGLAKDAGARLLWRFPPRRLEAESMRDVLLQGSGALDLKMGGPGFYLLDVDRENVYHYFPKEETGPAEWRRMVYMMKIRQERDAIFHSFDCPDGNQVMPKRVRSTTPLQALNLFNSRFIFQQSQVMTQRLEREVGADWAAQTRRAFALLFSREPTPEDLAESLALVREQGMPALCRALLNANELFFIY